MLEEQVADLRKQLSTVEHNLSASREDVKSLQQQLRDKVRERKRVEGCHFSFVMY